MKREGILQGHYLQDNNYIPFESISQNNYKVQNSREERGLGQESDAKNGHFHLSRAFQKPPWKSDQVFQGLLATQSVWGTISCTKLPVWCWLKCTYWLLTVLLNSTICVRQDQRSEEILNIWFKLMPRREKDGLRTVRIEFYDHHKLNDQDCWCMPQLLQN